MTRVWPVLLLAACSGTFEGGGRSSTAPDETSGPTEPRVTTPIPDPVIRLPAAVACDGRSTGRTYVGFDGEALDADRLPLAAGQDVARLRDGSDLSFSFQSRGLEVGSVPASVVQTFGVVPERWHQNAQASFASVYAAYTLAFKGCLTKLKAPTNYHPFGHADYAASPTAASASRQCQVIAKLNWRREMDTEELAACVDGAAEALTLETDIKRQWAAVCASVGASAGSLLF